MRSRNLDLRSRLVCPTYALWHVLHIILCTPLFSWSDIRICGVVCMRYCNIVAALNAIPMFVFLNKLVIFLIFGLLYVNVIQILRFFLIGLCVGGFLLCLSVEFLEYILHITKMHGQQYIKK